MFAKIVSNSIETYPYNPRIDYPQTAFPIGSSYPNFNCYWVFPSTPPDYDPENQELMEETPIFVNDKWEQKWIVIQKVSMPNWDNFNLQMMSNPRFNQVYNQCLSVAPIVCSALPVALDQVTSKGLSLFTIIWNQLCQIGGATAEDKLVWGTYAEDNNLPLDFIEVLIR
jgi:hypothetical protein